MKKVFFGAIMFNVLLVAPCWGISKTINPLVDQPDYRFVDIDGWKIPNLDIKGGTDINAGFTIKIQFTTPKELSEKETIWALGIAQGRYFDNMLSITQRNKTYSVNRHTQLGQFLRSYENEAWDKNLFLPNTNYTLVFEIDETRCLTTLWETGSPSKKKYEYTFYGLMGSDLKEELANNTDKLVITINQKFQSTSVFIADLGFGVGVKIPSPSNKSYITDFFNVSSGLHMGLKNYAVTSKPTVSQNLLRSYGTNLWIVSPIYKSSRNPNYYEVDIYNAATKTCLAPLHCGGGLKSQITVSETGSCNSWVFKKEDKYTSRFNILNGYNFEYLGIPDNSHEVGKPLALDLMGDGDSYLWRMSIKDYKTPIQPGFYKIKNKETGLYLAPRYLPYNNFNVVARTVKTEDSYIWYVTYDEYGTYHIMNIDSKKYLATLRSSIEENAEIGVQDNTGTGNIRWIVDTSEGENTYVLYNLTSGEFMGLANSTSDGEYGIIQKGRINGTRDQWVMEEITLNVAAPLGGVFRIGNAASETYITASTNGKDVVSSHNVDDPSSWWTVEFMENGGYALKNVKYAKYLSIYNSSISNNAKCILSTIDEYNTLGNSLFELLPYFDRPGVIYYWIQNTHSGLQLSFQKTGSANDIPLVQIKLNQSDFGNIAYRWGLQPVFDY